MLCVDESMSRWYGQGGNQINHWLPMYVVIDRKPENVLKVSLMTSLTISNDIIILSTIVSKSSANPKVFVCVTCFMINSCFLVIDILQVIHKTFTEHHVYSPAKIRSGLIHLGSWRQSILAQSLTKIKMLCNGNMA